MMEPIFVVRQGSGSYPVFAGRGLLASLASLLDLHVSGGKRFFIAAAALREKLGLHLSDDVIFLEDREQSKSIATAEELVSELLRRGAQRDSVVVAIGGGVVGDIAGFVAAILLRGVRLVHVPTTLLAQVDSSIGGKVGVNHPLGKNLVGAFHPPAMVVADVDLLATLPKRELRSGLFEVIKTGVIGDAALFELLRERQEKILAGEPDYLLQLVERSVRVKGSIVSADERETDLRRLLNYGHTIGHALEQALDYEQLTHGEAVAWGMIAVNEIARRRGTAGETLRAIEELVLAYAPAALPPFDRQRLLGALARDKKFTSAGRAFVLPVRIGECEIVTDVRDGEIEAAIDAMIDVGNAPRPAPS